MQARAGRQESSVHRPSQINSRGACIAPETSEGEQGKEVEMMPAAAPDPEQQQERDVTALMSPAPDWVGPTLSELQPLRARISQLLGPAGGPHRVVVTGDAGRRCLAFLETELSITAAVLTTLSSHELDLDDNVLLHELDLDDIEPIERRLSEVLAYANRVLHELDPSHDTLLRRASQCFQTAPKMPYFYSWLYQVNEYLQYIHLLLTGSDRGHTSKLAEEAGAIPLVGIDRPAKKILRWLKHQGNRDSTRLRVMSIVGPMGIGKTTLAVELRNRLRQHQTSGGRYYFQCNAMAQASRGTDRNICLLQDILSQVSESATEALSCDPSQAKTMKVLVHLVSEQLRDKRYFIIIDGIHKASDWEEIKGAFPADSNNLGSRILITTRFTSIAEACCSYDGLVHKMKPLNQIDSERLLLAKAVGSEDGCLPDNMKLFCDKILRRCDGIPLFIIGMADWLKGQLLQKQHPREDEDEEQVPELPERLEQALSSAFNDFPNDRLRAVLLYMSMFPYGYKLEKDRLMLKWIFEGFSSTNSDAQKLFSQLVDWNVITCVASNCKHKQDEADTCQWQVNHFVQQFLASKSAEMGFMLTTTTLNLLAASAATRTDRGNRTSSRMPRRLALNHPDPQLRSLLETTDLSQTRSLSVSGTVSGIPLEKFVNLVLLDLEGWENLKDEDLLLVCRSKMFFLSYLSARNSRVHKLPREIKELRMLTTLDVSYTQISELPLELFELRNLLHLDIRGTRISQLPKQIVDLRYELGSVVDTLATVDLSEHPASFVRALGDLRKLRVLAVTWSFHQSTDKEYCEAFLASIAKWEKLESLTIHCGLGCSMEFLGSLEKSRAPRLLKKFKVTAGRFASVPSWIHGLEILAFVQITVCTKQATDDLQILGALPKLQCLILGLDFIPTQAIEIEDQGFLELQRFSVDCPMPWLTFSTGAMLKLTYLQLKFCSTPAICCVPSGISNLPSLTEVALCYNAQYINSPSIKMTVEAVNQQVAEHRNPIDLFINGIEQDDVQEADVVTENTIGTLSKSNAGAEDDAQAVGEEATATAVFQFEITETES